MPNCENRASVIQHTQERPNLRPYASGTETVVETKVLSPMPKSERTLTRSQRKTIKDRFLGRR